MRLMDIFILLAKNKKFIICVSFLASILGFTLASVLPKTYKTEVRVRIDDPSSNSKVSLLTNMNKNIGSLFGGSVQNEASDLFIEILEGRNNLVRAIKEFKLDSIYGKISIDLTLKALSKDLDIGVSEESGIVYCGYQSENRKLAVDLINYLVSNANERYITLEKERQVQNRDFLFQKQQQLIDSMENVNRELLEFYKDNNVISIEKQIELSLTALSTYERKLKDFEIDQKFVRKSVVQGSSMDKKYKDMIAILQEEFNTLRTQRDKDYLPSRKTVLINTDWGMDKLLFEKIKLSQIEVIKDFIGTISKELALAEAQVSRTTPVVQIIQDAYYPDWKTKPKRATWMIMACFVAFSFSIFFVLLRALVNDEIKCENGQKLKDLLSALKP